MKTERKKRSWTPEQRAEQAKRLKERQIWRNSTGPRTAKGKSRAARNSYKHGAYSREILEMRAFLCNAARFLKHLKHLQKLNSAHNKTGPYKKTRNELRDPTLNPGTGRRKSLALTAVFQYESACLSGTKARPDLIVWLPLSSGGVGISYF